MCYNCVNVIKTRQGAELWTTDYYCSVKKRWKIFEANCKYFHSVDDPDYVEAMKEVEKLCKEKE